MHTERGRDPVDERWPVRSPSAVVVTGLAGAGVSEVALAVAAARAASRPTALLDVDERAPSLAARLGLPAEPCLRDAVDAVEYGQGDVARTLLTVARNLRVLPGLPAAAVAAGATPGEVVARRRRARRARPFDGARHRSAHGRRATGAGRRGAGDRRGRAGHARGGDAAPRVVRRQPPPRRGDAAARRVQPRSTRPVPTGRARARALPHLHAFGRVVRAARPPRRRRGLERSARAARGPFVDAIGRMAHTVALGADEPRASRRSASGRGGRHDRRRLRRHPARRAGADRATPPAARGRPRRGAGRGRTRPSTSTSAALASATGSRWSRPRPWPTASCGRSPTSGPLTDLVARRDVEEIFIEGGRVSYLDGTGRLRGLTDADQRGREPPARRPAARRHRAAAQHEAPDGAGAGARRHRAADRRDPARRRLPVGDAPALRRAQRHPRRPRRARLAERRGRGLPRAR